jgi:hypothetical protein
MMSPEKKSIERALMTEERTALPGQDAINH